MWHTNKSDLGGNANPKAKPRRTWRILRFLCGAIVVVMLPLSAGCSPGLLIGGAIAGSVLYAHLNKDNLPGGTERVRPPVYQGRTYAGSAGPTTTYTASNPPIPKVQPRPDYRPAVLSSVPEDALPDGRRTTDYESHSHTDSRITETTRAADAPPAQEPKPPPAPQSATVSPVPEGARAYRELRWEDAVRVLGRAIDTGICTESELSQAHVLLGAIAYQQGDAEAAKRHFMEAHRHDRQLEPSPQLFPPQLIDFFKTVNGP